MNKVWNNLSILYYREGVNPLVHVRYLIVAILFLITMPTVLADDLVPDDISATINKTILNDYGADKSPITVVVYNQTPAGKVPLAGLQVEFIMDNPGLGTFSPPSFTTIEEGKAGTSFLAGTTTGATQLFAKVYYTAGGTLQSKEFKLGTVYIQGYPDDIQLFSNKEWVVAGGTDTSTITLSVTKDGNPVPHLPVSLSIVESDMGSLSQISSSKTNDNGIVTARFTSSTKSGVANITARVTYENGEDVIQFDTFYLQKVDHDFAYKFDSPDYPDYENEVPVGTLTNISVKMLDKWGNAIDNKREVFENRTPEMVLFSVEGSPSTQYDPPYYHAQFWNGTGYEPVVTYPTTDTGIITADLRIDAKPGINYILISPQLATIADKYIQIYGISVGTPYKIQGWTTPSSFGGENPWVYTGTDPNDESRKFTLTYYVTDQYRNGIQLTDVNITINAGAETETLQLTTNATGYAAFKYGPRALAISDVVVTARPVLNESVFTHLSLDFVSTDPVDMFITANPQFIASRDAKPTASSQIRAKVINPAGDGVAGENVTFSIRNERYDEDYTTVLNPELESLQEITTDSTGYATVNFFPGSFTQVFGDDNYDSTATGHADVFATWYDVNGTPVENKVEVTWKNYPYLNAYTYLDKESVNVTDTINVTIKLVGDGYKMEAKPIDAIICHDRSGSMLYDYPDRMVPAMAAAQSFVENTAAGKDRTGLVSFGNKDTTDIHTYHSTYLAGIDEEYVCEEVCQWTFWGWWCYDKCGWQDWTEDDADYIIAHYPGNGKYYSDFATVDNGLDYDQTNVSTAISRLVPMGYTPMRLAIYKSIKELVDNPRPEAVRAIIVISDGDYNYYGDPLARGSGYTDKDPWWYRADWYGNPPQDYHKFDGLGSGQLSEQNMSIYANNNNIKIFSIAYAEDISEGGNETLRILSESTGGCHYTAPTGSDLLTMYSLIAGQLREDAGVDIEMYSDFGTVQVDMQPVAGNEVLTYIADDPHSTSTEKFDSKNTTIEYGWIDHTTDWETNQKLPFNIGTMHLNDYFEATMTFSVERTGSIMLFNHTQEAIFFNTPEGPQTLTIPDTYLYSSLVEDPDPGYGTFEETEFEVENPEGTIYEWTWTREYTGELPLIEQYFVSVDGGKSWTQVGERIFEPPVPTQGVFRYDIRNLVPPGTQAIVDFRLSGRAIDAPSPRRVQGQSEFNLTGIYILLE